MPLLALTIWLQVARPAEGVRLIAIVSTSQRPTDLSSADLRSIYLGQITRWPDHRPILPILLPLESAAGKSFLERVIGMADLDYAQHWIGMVFRGRASSPPLVAQSTDDAARFVATHPAAIALVASYPTVKNVRVLNIDGKSPDDIGYPLRW